MLKAAQSALNVRRRHLRPGRRGCLRCIAQCRRKLRAILRRVILGREGEVQGRLFYWG